jgi:hypothetical protein
MENLGCLIFVIIFGFIVLAIFSIETIKLLLGIMIIAFAILVILTPILIIIWLIKQILK